MKTLIAIPCMDTVPVPFMWSLLRMEKTEDTRINLASGSLVYDSRNDLIEKAIIGGFDRVLWLDSDMSFEPDLMLRLNADLDAGLDIVTGVYYERKGRSRPTIFSECGLKEDGQFKIPYHKFCEDYPKDHIFEIEACGFGCVMMNVSAARKIVTQLGGKPFMPVAGFGEDLSFCMRARHVGLKIWCDPSVQCGHVGWKTYTEDDYRAE